MRRQLRPALLRRRLAQELAGDDVAGAAVDAVARPCGLGWLGSGRKPRRTARGA
ncbi:MAG TPA: hypothetical protein VKK31_12260 [Thermoanaerobaculia bacterium]|nr:hypothetical protein [Thermoanaerobaculia bacterium]